ncbi:sensor histidine kinase [Stratiformator vulcanicus]|uniref:histidine kinase n=1 Tax=Stratiformator vulcanicus TaxID=2527980 RepID=A0A517R0A0_9PLAN|nr:ATP-binding protein [Stratiformator vulcanicus]QDT37254.1 Signal transduction histidine-protein kinase BarA [Stratiformator vulcanicus]
MSYRTVKRLLGETSLERKCRFLFGTGLLLLIAGSFSFYAWLNVRVVYEQNRNVARALIKPILWHKHRGDPDPEFSFTGSSTDAPVIDSWQVYNAAANAPAADRPGDPISSRALLSLRAGADEFVSTSDEQYRYFAPLIAGDDCFRSCHIGESTYENYHAATPRGGLIGMVKISLPLAETKRALVQNNAFLVTTAIVTAFLAMLSAYAIVRYVIVKPVLHLKDVADEIARGTIDLRADIRTGDEFEELSHAFNRMLRHLITMQDELRDLNVDLDGKVDELARVNLRLYETNRLKDEFLATMSHELRTPLNSILGFSDVLSGAENLNDKQKRFVGNIRKSGGDLMVLINDILDLAKIESGKLTVEETEFSLSEVVETQVDQLLPLADRKNIQVKIDVSPDIPALWQDAGKLQQILNNLLSNAIKFTPEGGQVRVYGRLADREKHFDLIVEDTGIGIPLEDQSVIFEKFRQGRSGPGQSDAMTREHGGTGLGLSIVRELSKLLGGDISLESEFGKGSTFTIRLPIRMPDRSNMPSRPNANRGVAVGPVS